MPGIDSDTKLMLHCNGSDTSTTFADDSPSAHSVTANGTAQIDTDESVFGGASGLFDGNSDYLTVPDSSDFDILASNLDDWTIDLRFNADDVTTSQSLLSHGNFAPGNATLWLFELNNDDLTFRAFDGGSTVLAFSSTGNVFSINTWYHIALIKVGEEYGLYVDGVQVAYATTSNTFSTNETLRIGVANNSSSGLQKYYNGHMDEIRIQNSNYFSASPNSGLTDTITVPTAEYSSVITEYLNYAINLTITLTDNKRYSEDLSYNINDSVSLTDFQTYLESLEYTANLTQNLSDFQTYLESLDYNVISSLSLQDIQSYIDNLNYIINNSYSITDLQNYIDSLNYTINYLLTVADLKPGINFNPFKNQWNIPENIKLNWSINPIKINYKLPENFKIYWK